jgi:hypothetical protein
MAVHDPVLTKADHAVYPHSFVDDAVQLVGVGGGVHGP